MKRKAVTAKSFAKARTARTPFGQGISSIKATTGKVDAEKMRVALRTGDVWHTSGLTYNSAYKTSYANSGQSAGAFGDVPLYFALMNENNGGILYWPVNLKEKYEWYRYLARTDSFVSRAIELHVQLPLSKLILKMPKMKNEALRNKILKKYENMIKRIKLFEKLQSILFEYFILGNCFCFLEYDEEKKEWAKMIILPPEEITITRYPFSETSRIEYYPEMMGDIIAKFRQIDFENHEDLKNYVNDDEFEIVKRIPIDLIKFMIKNGGKIVMDTDPYSGDGENKVGSFVYHLARSRHEYHDLGVSIIETVLIPLLMKEHFKYTQLSLASRNMTPRNKIQAPNVPLDKLYDLREQVDLSMLDPDYSIVTNYDWDWQQIGADQRLIDLAREYETIENQLFAGLGVTRELLTGEGMYSGSKITLEILNTRYLIIRDMLMNMVEESIFKPVAEDNGFFEVDEDGNKTYFIPKLSFSRLTIRDNAEVFDSLFQLYQKGSLPVDAILEMFNFDGDEVKRKLIEDQFTVKDAIYNDMIRRIYDDIGSKIVESTDLLPQIIESLRGPLQKPLTYKPPQGEGGEAGGMGGLMPPAGEEGTSVEEQDVAPEESPAEEQPAETDVSVIDEAADKAKLSLTEMEGNEIIKLEPQKTIVLTDEKTDENEKTDESKSDEDELKSE